MRKAQDTQVLLQPREERTRAGRDRPAFEMRLRQAATVLLQTRETEEFGANGGLPLTQGRGEQSLKADAVGLGPPAVHDGRERFAGQQDAPMASRPAAATTVLTTRPLSTERSHSAWQRTPCHAPLAR
ncbi:MAG: hypothetical protein M9919_04835 [Burkholderiaceae bacterium]|nr:hypothetical protein [Burkholderiaceae bacterium]